MIDWENLTDGQKEAVRLISERSFIRFMQSWFQISQGQKLITNWHHEYMSSIAHDLVNGSRGNTIINIPPGGTKTEMWSIFFPAWTLIQKVSPPERLRYLNLSYADTLVKRNSRRIRDMIKSKEWQSLWPSEFSTDQAEEWQLIRNGKPIFEVVSKSTGGQVTGGRGGYPGSKFSGMVFLDDPDKPDEMFSQTRRSKNHRLLVDTVRSRRGDKSKAHPTPIGLIQQRLHQMDSTGFILSGGMGLEFDCVKIPALIDEGYIEQLPEPFRSKCWASVKGTDKAGDYWSFWPENEHVGQLMDLWGNNEYTFMSQYMQAPIALGGQIFDPEWWHFYESVSHFEWRFITADTAQKTNEWNDFSVFCEWGVLDGNLYLIDMHRGKYAAPDLRAQFKSFVNEKWAKNDHVNGVLRSVHVEDKSSGTGLIQDLANELPVSIDPIQRNRDKFARSFDAAPQIKAGKVWLPTGERWVTEFVSEHSAFSADDTHQHDDMVDNTMDAVDIALLGMNAPFGALLPARMR